MPVDVAAARAFLYRDARVVERRLYETLFESAAPGGVARALTAYLNDDGGFGHAFEPDKRAPQSQPLDTALALETLALAGAGDAGFAHGACRFFASVCDGRGAVPIGLASSLQYPHAEHWTEWVLTPGVFGTAAAAAALHGLEIRDAWLGRADEFLFEELEREPPDDAHAVRESLRFLERHPDRARADALVDHVAARLEKASWFLADATSREYGVTPLEFAPSPESRQTRLFPRAQLDAHLDRLERDQQSDGGWPISWNPASDAGGLEWRGERTLFALRVLRAWGRL